MMRKSGMEEEKHLKKGPWTPEEDKKLIDHIQKHGHGSWRALPKLAGLNRCGKSCRLRWTNYLRPDIKRGKFSDEEEQIIINLHQLLGNKWSAIAQNLPGRTDNEIKNFWNTHLKKKLLQMGIDPVTHRPRTDLNLLANLPQLLAATSNFTNLFPNNNLPNWPLHTDPTQLAKLHLLNNILQVLSSSTPLTNIETATNLLGPNFRDQQYLYDYIKFMNSQFDGSMISSSSSSQPVCGGFSSQDFLNFEATQPPLLRDYNAIKDSKMDINNNNDQVGCSYDFNISTSIHQLPPLVSASPDHCPPETKINPNDISNPSSTSTAFEAWGDLMDDEGSDNYWRDLIEQASSQPWPMSD